MRDSKKNEEYFAKYLELSERLSKRTSEKLTSNQINAERVSNVKIRYLYNQINSLIAKYSYGVSFGELKKNLLNLIDLFPEYWISKHVKIRDKKDEYLDCYYVHSHWYILQILSFGALLDEPIVFVKIQEIIDRDQVGDRLFECFLERYIPHRISIKETYNEEKNVSVKTYKYLREAIELENKVKQEYLIKRFLEESFYNKDAPFYNSHKSKADIYNGYWSFESAALVCLLDLDDTSFRDNKYYPKDIVDYYRAKNKTCRVNKIDDSEE